MACLVVMALLLAMASHSSGTWCICKDGVGDAALQKTLDYACGAGADCNPTHQSGPCFNPNTVRAHCSYAVNSYFQKNRQASTACDFGGTASLVTSDPSTAGCTYPSSASGGTTTTPPSSTSPTSPVAGTPTTTPVTGTPTTTPVTGTPTTTPVTGTPTTTPVTGTPTTTPVTGTPTTTTPVAGTPTTTNPNGGSPLVTTPSTGGFGGTNSGLGPTGVNTDMSVGEILVPIGILLFSSMILTLSGVEFGWA